MAYVYLTAQFKSDLDQLDNSMKGRVSKTIERIGQDPYYSGLETHPHRQVHDRKIMRSRVNDNFRVLWEWTQKGSLHLWRVGSHSMIDAINYIRTEPREVSLFTRDEADHSAIELESLEFSRDLPQPFKYVPLNILRLFGVPDDALQSVQSLSDAEVIWDLPIPENVKTTLYDILANPLWTLEDLLDTNQLLYRTTVDQLEGYCEGRTKQLLLNLNDEQERYVQIRANGPLLVKGVAGSGKTTIGLYRAHYLAEKIHERRQMFGERSSVLMLTYTTTLTKTLKQLYSELYGEKLPYALQVESIRAWMMRRLREAGAGIRFAELDTRLRLVGEAIQEVAAIYPDDRVVRQKPKEFFLDELDEVILSRRIERLEEYQDIERVGRGSALDRARHRPIVWEICRRYRDKLDQANMSDWAELARLVEQRCQPLPQYDVVIVDEAQDLPPSEIQLVTRLLSDYNDERSLTLLADPAQSIYYRGIPWKEAGINILGRTRILAKNFRNTKQILEAARHIVDRCEDLKNQEEFIPPTSSRRPGAKPIIVSYSYAGQSNQFLADEIIRLCQTGGFRPGDIAVLARSKNLLTKYIQDFLQKQNILCRFHRDEDFQIFENEVKLITMHSAKGLEFPVVFLIGLSDQYMPYINKDSDSKLDDEMQERKLFYVSMTRAAERLYLLHPKRNRCRFLHDLDASTVREVSC